LAVLIDIPEIGSICAGHRAAKHSQTRDKKPPVERRQHLLLSGGFRFVVRSSPRALAPGVSLGTPRLTNTLLLCAPIMYYYRGQIGIPCPPQILAPSILYPPSEDFFLGFTGMKHDTRGDCSHHANPAAPRDPRDQGFENLFNFPSHYFCSELISAILFSSKLIIAIVRILQFPYPPHK